MRNDLRIFEKLIADLLVESLERRERRDHAAMESASLDRGLVFARAMAGKEIHATESVPAPAIVIDALGRSRPIYRTLLVYAWLRSAEMGKLVSSEELSRWCDTLQPSHSTAEAAWEALVRHIADKRFGRIEGVEFASVLFRRMARKQQPDGSLLPASTHINPETGWFNELALLHAMSTYAVETGDRLVEAAVMRAAEFHMAETQPDHATQQPWALFAFLSNPQTRPQAEQILHAVSMQESIDAVSMILLADVLWCIRRQDRSEL